MTTLARRQYRTGSLYQRKDGRWIGAAAAGWRQNGTRKTITVSATTKTEAKRKLDALVRRIARDGAPADSTITVKDWAGTWLDRTQRDIRPKTWITNRSNIERWVVPVLGRKKLETLTPGDMRAVANAIRGAGLSSSTGRRVHTVLTEMLKAAQADGHHIPANVFAVRAPAVAVNDRDAIPLVDTLALLKVAITDPDGTRWVAALLQGMRQGEALGLTWDMTDLHALTMDVSWQLQALPYVTGRKGALRVPDGYEYRQLDGALCLVRPKTAKGQRIVPVVPAFGALLAQWRTVAPSSPHALVWPRPDGRPRLSSDDRTAWYALQTRADVAHHSGRPYYLHEARHSAATLLMELGVDETVRMGILGHASITTTRGYQHASQAQARMAMDALAARLQISV